VTLSVFLHYVLYFVLRLWKPKHLYDAHSKDVLSEEGEVIQKVSMRSVHLRMLLWLLDSRLFNMDSPPRAAWVIQLPHWLVS
jgi:hypothetical protein